MIDWAELLDKAAILSVHAHQGQRDIMGQPYFQHPMRVAMACSTPQEKIVALLHDVIEATTTSSEDLLEMGFPDEIVDAIISVTKISGEPYVESVARAAQNSIGRVVKFHDLEDNLNIFRLNDLDDEMARRLNRYLRTYHFLKKEIEDNKLLVKSEEEEDSVLPMHTLDMNSTNVENNEVSNEINNRSFYIHTIGCNAKARLLTNGKIVILKGSILRKEVTQAFNRKEIRQKIIEGYCTLTPEGYRVDEDLPPMSPSGASGLVQARSSNGKRDWMDKDGNPLGTYL